MNLYTLLTVGKPKDSRKKADELILPLDFATNSIVVLVRARDGGRVGCVCNAAAETVSFSAAYQDRKLAP